MARKFTKGTQRAIVEALKAGEYAKVAAEAQGVDESTYYRWLQRGEAAAKAADNGKPVDAKELGYADFLVKVRRAEAEAEQAALRRVQGSEDWRATAWFLERRYPGRWAKRQNVDVTTKEQPIRIVEVVRTVRASADET
jgi:transposase